MARTEDFATTAEAAALLGVSVQRLNQLAETGAITRLARGLIDRSSVDRYIAERSGGRTRVWAEHTAWAAVALLSGDKATWLGQTQTSRLRASLRSITDTYDLLVRLRDRARITTYSGHRSVAARLRGDLVVASRKSLGLVDSTDVVDGYIGTEHLDALVNRYRLQADASGSITLRATGFDLDTVAHLARGSVLTAADAAASLDPRERALGLNTLTAALESFR